MNHSVSQGQKMISTTNSTINPTTEPTTETITNNLTANNQNLAVLKKQFGQCFAKDGSFDFEKFKQELTASEVDIYKESYGLDWLGKSYARLLATDEASTLLSADDEHNAKAENANSHNLLLKGDNLEVLKHLSHAYYEQVKMIYIDPPYNTGSDGFVYADNRQFTAEQLEELAGVSYEKAQQILTFTRSKSNSHSAWLTFMYPRLYIAKQLLKDDGVIFVSIDDNEVAQLRLLMDDVFGEENFVGEFIWKNRQNKDNRNISGLSIDHEYIMCFSKTTDRRVIRGAERRIEQYKNPDNDSRGLWVSGNMVGLLPKEQRPNCHYDLIDPLTGINYGKPKMGWRYDKSTMSELIKDGRILFPQNKDGRPRRKVFLNEVNAELPNHTSFIGDKVYTNHGTKEIDVLFNQKIFNFPKPTKLLKELMVQGGSSGKSNDLILDFFAGSGTTADAVMQLNAEDGGNRQFILVQLPEVIDSKNSKTAYDFVHNDLGVAQPTIFDITKERIIRSANKITHDNAESKEAKDLSKQDMGFKIFETMPIWEGYEFEIEKFHQQIELFDQSKLTDDDLQALLITWKTYDGSPLTEDYQQYVLQADNLPSYTAYYVSSQASEKLYLMHQGFTTAHLKTLLQQLDNDSEFNPTSIVAFGYHFDSKNLRELFENIKTFANKKSSDIDFVVRY